jgi:hypothetical protein
LKNRLIERCLRRLLRIPCAKGGPGRPSFFPAILVAALFAAACTAGVKTKTSTPAPPPDGSSIERAIPILESTETAGIAAERAWIKENYPGARKVMGGLQGGNGRHYDVVVLRLPDGSEKTIYFDATAFFGF